MSFNDWKLNQKSLPGLSSEVYSPDYVPEDTNLNDFLFTTDIQGVSNKVGQRLREDAGEQKTPLTKEESDFIDESIKLTQRRIVSTRKRIASVKGKVDEEMSTLADARGGEISFKLDISKKPRIKRAIKKLFGIKSDTITYSMYKELLEARDLLEARESDEYVNGPSVIIGTSGDGV